MSYAIRDILTIVSGKLLNPQLFDTQIERLLFDSRHLVFPTKTLFFAFASQRQDGHQFIEELYELGVRCFIVTRKIESIELDFYPQANFIKVSSSVAALQTLVKHHRQQFSLPVIGITGSNGKTIVKEWLFQLLQDHYKIVRNPSSYNSQIGVPLSVWQINPTNDLGIFEAGISQMGEMEKIAPVIDCQIGIFTNIGAAHSEGFISQKEKIREKLKLFDNARTIIYCRDHELIHEVITANKNFRQHPQFFTWSIEKEADVQIVGIEKKETKTIIAIAYQDTTFSFSIPFTDFAAVENAIHVCVTALFLGVLPPTIQKRMPQLASVSMRLELKKGIHNCTIINDSYNSDLTSLELALNFATKRANDKKIVLVLSDILQSG
ncbi:MAG: Mur ligase family protein, partial [Bacteroidota bacterium]